MTRDHTNHHQAPDTFGAHDFKEQGMGWEIPTFRQYDQAKRRQIADKYKITVTELSDHYGPNHYRQDWEDKVTELFNAGATFPTRQWNSLPQHLQRRILRSPRALKIPGNVEPWKEKP